MPQRLFNILHTGDAVCKQPKCCFFRILCCSAQRKGCVSIQRIYVQLWNVCDVHVWERLTDLSRCAEKGIFLSRQKEEEMRERERKGVGGMKDVISQDRSDLTSLRISMWGLDWTYTCWSAADFSGWKKRYNSVSRELRRESTPPPPIFPGSCHHTDDITPAHHHSGVRVLKHHPQRGADLVSLPG